MVHPLDNQDLPAAPMIVQKQDGGYLYATTDLAAARYRLQTLQATRLIYVTDARQTDHFKQVFSTLQRAGWTDHKTQLQHVAFGTILGPDRKPFKTRSGQSIALEDLMDEAIARARAITEEKHPDLAPKVLDEIAHVMGIGALKYADLRSDRIRDVLFDWDKILSFEGNTAPYLQNAVVRMRAILAKVPGLDRPFEPISEFEIAHPAERQLIVTLLQFDEHIQAVSHTLQPHLLCQYLYQLSVRFHHFYEHCPVLKSNPTLRQNRVQLIQMTDRVLTAGLELLGIETLNKM